MVAVLGYDVKSPRVAEKGGGNGHGEWALARPFYSGSDGNGGVCVSDCCAHGEGLYS